MTLLQTHLDQIELCASTISELPFPPPGIFTNALLHLPDITALIRDPDSHESALFSVVPSKDLHTTSESKDFTSRRSTVFDVSENGFDGNIGFKGPRRNTAVAAILGGNMAERIRRERTGDSLTSTRKTGMLKDEVDIELLLKGAEKLCKVYPMVGAFERISALRMRHDKVAASIQHYEGVVAEQNEQLKRMSRAGSFGDHDTDLGEEEMDMGEPPASRPLTQEDLKREEEWIKELERRKRTLEERVSGMKKDLGGILR